MADKKKLPAKRSEQLERLKKRLQGNLINNQAVCECRYRPEQNELQKCEESCCKSSGEGGRKREGRPHETDH